MSDHEPQHKSAFTAAASALFQMKTGQTPEHFAQGMWDKLKSVTVDPVVHIYGKDGMVARAAEKAADKLQGVEKPDSAYASKEEHARYLDSIIAVGAALFPGLGELAARPPNAAMVTNEGVVVRMETSATADGAKATQALAEAKSADGAKPAKPAEVGKPAEGAKPAEAAKPTEAAKPGETAKPAESAKPAEAAKPTEGAKPGEAGKPADGGKVPEKAGTWATDLTEGQNMNPKQAQYQEQVTGRRAEETYHLNGRSFDGHEPGRNGAPDTLVEAKDLADDGRFAKAYDNMNKGNFSDFAHLYDRATSLLEQAKGQVHAAEGTGMRIEWRVSGEKATEAIKVLFNNDPELRGKINVEHVPAVPKAERAATEKPGVPADKAPKIDAPQPEKPTPKPEAPQQPRPERPPTSG